MRAADIFIFRRYSSKACSIKFLPEEKNEDNEDTETHDGIVPLQQYWYVQQYGPPAEPVI